MSNGKFTPLIALIFGICSFILSSQYSVFAEGELRGKVPDLCYKCHVKLREGLSRGYVHFPFKDGKCNSCHDSHAGNAKGLLKEDINSLCLGCHDAIKKLLAKSRVHQAVKRGVCTDCHYAHSSEIKYLLVKAQNVLCWDCHAGLKEQLTKSYVHVPFKGGECSSCHNPHASAEENQVRVSMSKLCKSCHGARCRVGDVSITFMTEKMRCETCHTGHASDSRGLLGPYGHSAFLAKKCDQCHNPILTGAKMTTKTPGKDLCFGCHKKDSVKFKENDAHVSDSNDGCNICHSYHASKRKNLTVKESQACFSCHENTEKRTLFMEKALRTVRCVPIKERKCFECHMPPHSQNPLYFKADNIKTCARCHTEQHKVVHPLGKDVKDPRNGQPITCITCHSMHSSKAEFMLYFDRKRQLCIQCHKR